MDGNCRTVQADSATTSGEICEQLSEDLNLEDTFGFSLFITLYDKVLSLGSSTDHVFDAVSQCEQYAKEQGVSERSAPWKLFFRKEIFTPWHNPSENTVATKLIYHQLIRGIKFGEYRCSTEGDIAMIAAQQYYIENGSNMDPKQLHQTIRKYVPDHYLQAGEKALASWEKKINEAFAMSISVQEKSPVIKCQEDIVTYGKISWPILFSKFFEAVKTDGPELTKNNLIIAVNWTGVYMVDDQEQIILELTFAEIMNVQYERNTDSNLHNLNIKTVLREIYVFQTPDAEEICNLITYLLNGLKKRSQFVIAVQDYRHPGEASTYLNLKKGDLIHLLNGVTGEEVVSSTWGYGECNGKHGNFPTEYVHILPVLASPPKQIQLLFTKDDVFKTIRKKQTAATIQRMKYHTLATYANEHFRQARRYTVARGTAIQAVRRNSREELWKHTSEPIQAPLLQKLQNDDKLSKEACLAFMAILKYMGDIPSVKTKFSNEYTTQIFRAALNNNELQDEIYCQIIRQLTHNRLQKSEDLGWELMWLATGLFSPSKPLVKELTQFLKSRIHPFAPQCLDRLQKIEKCGQRKFPPYTIEIEAIKHRSSQIYHKVYFPDDTDEAFEINSITKAKDLCYDIADRLELKNCEGFSLFVMIADKIFSVPEDYFFFDFIFELIEWIQQTKPNWNCKY